MCRNIKTLRAPYAIGVTDEDVRAAALQYVRTIGGFRLPSPSNAEIFDQAVETITAATQDLLARLEASPGDSVALTDGPLPRARQTPVRAAPSSRHA